MGKIKLDSKITTTIYPGITYDEHTSPAPMGNGTQRSVTQTWTGKSVKISKGTHEYDDVIASWKNLKDLVAKGHVVVVGELPPLELPKETTLVEAKEEVLEETTKGKAKKETKEII